MDTQRIRAITNYAAEYIHRWPAPRHWRIRIVRALVLLAAGHGGALIPTCEHILRELSAADFIYAPESEQPPSSRYIAPAVRALSFLRPEDVHALHVGDPRALHFAATTLQEGLLPGSDAASPDSRHLELTSVTVGRRVGGDTDAESQAIDDAFSVIESSAASLKVLIFPLEIQTEAGDRTIAKCVKLESLTSVRCYAPSAWLCLTQLHTLCGVEFELTPPSSIAAALPRLHTLEASVGFFPTPAAVTGFFDLLLPRLRVCNISGWWPEDDDESHPAVAATDTADTADAADDDLPPPPPLLPLLSELSWSCPYSAALHGFHNARPVTLKLPHEAVVQWLNGRHGDSSALTNVRELAVGGRLDTLDVAALLGAAPQLRDLRVYSLNLGRSAAASTLPDFFTGLSHPRLRYLDVGLFYEDDDGVPPLAEDCALHLRQLHFPRLCRFLISGNFGEAEYYVTGGRAELPEEVSDE